VRDEVVDYVRYWSDKTAIKAMKMVNWIGISRSKFYHWQGRYGKVNEHGKSFPTPNPESSPTMARSLSPRILRSLSESPAFA